MISFIRRKKEPFEMLLPPEDQQKINEEAQKLVNQANASVSEPPFTPVFVNYIDILTANYRN